LRVIEIVRDLLFSCKWRMRGAPPDNASDQKQQHAENEDSKSQLSHESD
jgi:hypothetical protein